MPPLLCCLLLPLACLRLLRLHFLRSLLLLLGGGLHHSLHRRCLHYIFLFLFDLRLLLLVLSLRCERIGLPVVYKNITETILRAPIRKMISSKISSYFREIFQTRYEMKSLVLSAPPRDIDMLAYILCRSSSEIGFSIWWYLRSCSKNFPCRISHWLTRSFRGKKF